MSSSKTTNDKELLEDIENIFNRFDVNGDSKISLAELSNVYKELGDGTVVFEDREVRFVFAMYYKDKYILISLEELQKGLGYFFDDCSRISTALDTDGDGDINFEEFKNIMQIDIG
ncbi:hypothetical protein MKX01_042110 [Papaver californicum]|nr:hypothetical protein MKX01_042110 [Papaver californicum]